MKRDGACHSLWQDTTDAVNNRNTSISDRKFDVIIAGAGITGITTGLLLQQAGKSVLIAEAQSPGFGTTGGTTAHLNTMMDTPYSKMQKNFGENNTRLAAKAITEAVALVKNNVQKYKIDCGFRDCDAYIFSQDKKQSDELEEIVKATNDAGVEANLVNELPVSISFEKVARFPGQGCFHPTRYIEALLEAFMASGGVLLQDCRVMSIDEGEPHKVHTSKGDFEARDFIYATHIPPGVNLLHFRCAPYRSYAFATRLKDKKDFTGSLIYDMYDPYHYYRTQEIDGEYYLIAGGEDHKTGHEENTENCFRKLEAYVRQHFSIGPIEYRWSSQYFEPNDGLPYIGHLPGHSDHMFVATGYGGNGITYSNVAAVLLSDLIVTGESEYRELFNPNRVKPVAGFSNFVKESADVVGKLFGKLVPAEKLTEINDLAKDEARVVKYEGERLAIYKDSDGEVHALHSACTHIKCDVAWNNAEKTWDCPCHGSRFSYTGEMLTAPARKDLEQVNIQVEEKV